MRQNSRVEPPTQPAIALHPILSSALASLDIQLEDELVRYRRQRLGARPTVRQLDRNRSPESLDLIAVAATPVGQSTAVQPVPVLDERLAGVAGKSIAPDAYKPIPAFTANPQPFEGAIALRATKPLTPDRSAAAGSLSSDDAHALAPAANPDLDDYLESSEALLRSLAEEQAEVQAERHFMQNLLTPLGLGAMLLLLLSSAMFGYVIMNPSSLSWTAKQNHNPVGTPPGPNARQTAMPPPQPDLAKREFPDLNLSNLGTVDASPGTAPSTASSPKTAPTLGSQPAATPKASPTGSQPSSESAAPAQAPIPAATSGSSRPARTTEAPQSSPSRSPVQTSAPRRAPTVTVPAATASTQGSGGSPGSYQYKVGIPFENDQTLENARKVVPDAFVRTLPDGRTIVQVGAARDEAEGRSNVQKLRDQGLSSTEVYKR